MMEMDNQAESVSSAGELMESGDEPMDFEINEDVMEAVNKSQEAIDASGDIKNGDSPMAMETVVAPPPKSTDGELSSDGALSLSNTSSPKAENIINYNLNNEQITSAQFSDQDDDFLDLNSPPGSPVTMVTSKQSETQLESTNKTHNSPAEVGSSERTNIDKNSGVSSQSNSGKIQNIAQSSTVNDKPLVEDTGEIMEDTGEIIEDTGEIIEDNKKIIDDKGEIIDDTGEISDDNGEIIDDNGEVIDDDGEVIDDTGEIMSDDEGDCSDDDDGSLNLDESEPKSLKKDTSIKIVEDTKQQANSVSVHDRLDFSLRASHDDHGELDYEEEVDDGLDTSKKEEESHIEEKEEGEESEKEDGEHISEDDTDGELDDDDDCEEGEIKDIPQIVPDMEEGEELSDIDDVNMEPYGDQPLCRFFIRGSCTWGMNCRFFHPGVHNGSYNDGQKDWDANEMGDSEAGVIAPPVPSASPPAETAWERGLRQAKELRKKSQKRKETEPDFEEKRKNLSLKASDVVIVEDDTKASDDRDHNKENEQEKIQFDPYYDNIASPPTPFEDDEFTYNTKPVAGWHGGGNYENFEVRWNREPPKQHFTEPYPDFRIPERERSGRGKETAKYTAKYRYNQGQGNERYEKKEEEQRGPLKRYKKYESYVGDMSDKPPPRRPQENTDNSRTRGEQWIDPWARAKSPVRRKNSSSRSRSRGRRRSRSGSRSSSYSSGSFSSRSRSSSYSSRSSYSRSSSYSSRSSSRSRSPPPRRKGLPLVDPHKRPLIPPKPSELPPRSFVTKAGPMVPSLATKPGGPPGKDPALGIAERRVMGNRPERRVSLDVATREPVVKIPEGPPKPPVMQKSTTAKAVTKPAAKPAAKPVAKPAAKPTVKLTVTKTPATKAVTVKPVASKPVTTKTVEPKTAAAAPKPAAKVLPEPVKLTVDTRPGRSLRPKTRSVSSGSSSSRSRSRSFSSSASSHSKSKSRSRSTSGSSSSSSSSSDSDDLYGNIDSPTQSKSSRSPQAISKVRKRSYRGQPSKHNSREPWRGAERNSNMRGAERGPERGSERSRQDNMYGRKNAEKVLPTPVMSQAKDPLKLQGQKSSIKLTLKSTKASDSSVAKKRPLVDNVVDAPPAKKPAISPAKEPKEPVRLTLPKTDKLIKPVKEVTKSRPQEPVPVKSPAKPPPPAKPVPPPAEPAPKKKSASSRREELLKQLKAVEDAIARKRTK